MLSDVWKDKLAANLEKMTEMRAKYPDKFRFVHGYLAMEKENKTLAEQINNYKNSISGINNTQA